ncbi:MAG: hypothetical protein ABI647_12385 [Gemmatimonadota bacterium]
MRAALHFRGTPGSLSAAVSEGEVRPRRLSIQIGQGGAAYKGKTEPIVARASRVEGDLVLQMTLPPRTPPGTYEGTTEVDGEQRPVVIEVEPEIELALVPDQLTLQGAPGERLQVALTVVNAGNVAVEIRKAHGIGIFAEEGLERSLHRAYRDERPEGVRRIDYLADLLAEEHGGIVRVGVEEGAGNLEPGETRELKVTLSLPADLKRGRTYSGIWPLHDLRYFVQLIISEGTEPSNGTKAR